MSDIRNEILDKYYEYRSRSVGMDDKSKLQRHYDHVVKHNYVPYIKKDYKNILEIGCYTGFTLRTLKELNLFKRIEGLELSGSAADIAKKYTGLAEIYMEDAFQYLPKNKSTFDVIVMKAVLEHIKKEKTGILLNLIYQSLKPGGVALISVPNMDWISSMHERYMDFTHETGFTTESLQDIMSMHFDTTHIKPMKYDFIYGVGGFLRIKLFQPVVKFFIKSIFKMLGQGAYRKTMFDRSLLAVGWKQV